MKNENGVEASAGYDSDRLKSRLPQRSEPVHDRRWVTDPIASEEDIICKRVKTNQGYTTEDENRGASTPMCGDGFGTRACLTPRDQFYFQGVR
jgi:hypothetical protein